MADPRAAQFLAALAKGAVALHPTDTLPGLTADPRGPEGMAALATLKTRPDGKPFIGLVADLESACRWWEPLPAGWRQALTRLWPGPVTVVWLASPDAPASLVGADGTLALRVPRLPPAAFWFLDVLRAVNAPLPTTSVNLGGELPALTWTEAVTFAASRGASEEVVYVPAGFAGSDATFTGGEAPRASTVVRIEDDSERAVPFSLLRSGAVSEAHIRGAIALGVPL